MVSGVHEIPTFDEKALIIALRRDQEGKSTFPEFLKSAWEAGVLRYVADFTSRKVSYFGVNGESYVEEYLNDKTLGSSQIRFVELIIDQLTARGVMQSETLYEPLFLHPRLDRPHK